MTKFQISSAPAALPHSRKKLGVPAVAAVSRPLCIEPKARKEEYFGLETEPTSTHLSQMKFQLSPAPSRAGSFRRKLPGRSCQVRPLIRGRTLPVTALSSGDSS